MTIYHFYSLISITLFTLIHLFGNRWLASQQNIPQRYVYSIGGGVAIAYVFIDLLPKLCSSDILVRMALHPYIPYIEKHVYITALMGFMLFYLVDRSQSTLAGAQLSINSYALFNFLIGYALADPFNPEVRPLLLFTFAIGLHLFVNDHSISEKLGDYYGSRQKWILALALYLGWFTGVMYELPTAAVALVSAFIGGGVIMNVTRHELPAENPNSTPLFIISTVLYALILLLVGRAD